MPASLPLPVILLNAHWQMHLTPRGHFAIKDAVASLGSNRFALWKLDGDEFVNADGSVPSLMIYELDGEPPVKANAVVFDRRSQIGLLYLCHIPKGVAAPRTDAGIKRFMRKRGMAI